MEPDTMQRNSSGATSSASPSETLSLSQSVPEALRHLKAQILAGVPWQRALLEAVGMWTLPEEEYQGRTYRYLIHGEAFDWVVLAERLCAELDGVIPADEKEALLFSGRIPESIEPDLFRELLGANKYPPYLNFWYGVVVEEALQLSVEEDVRKRHIARCYADTEDLIEEVFVHFYRASRTDLIEEFGREIRHRRNRPYSLSEMK